VILVDANILIYAGVSSSSHHERARAWLDEQISAGIGVGLSWQCLLAYLRITTRRGSFQQTLSIEGAWAQISAWLAQPSVWIPQPTDRHAALLETLMNEAQASGDLVSDAHLAVLAIEHGLTLCTNDRDFARFPNLKWMNPLTS
jgi:toxin-antitoxin system PIN domain toxin